MNLKSIRRAFATLAVGVVVTTGSAFADTITQTFTFGPTGTEINNTNTAPSGSLTNFNFFQSAGAPGGAVLNSVTLRVQINETVTALSFTNSSGATQRFAYQTTGAFDIYGTMDSTALSDLQNAAGTGGTGTITAGNFYNLYRVGNLLNQSGTGGQDINNGVTLTYLPSKTTTGNAHTASTSGNGILNFDSGIVTSTNTGFYNTTGTFNIAYSTAIGQNVVGAGGNLTASQTTVSSATYTIVYDYTVPTTPAVPEPATFAMIGGGLIAIGFMRKRRSAR